MLFFIGGIYRAEKYTGANQIAMVKDLDSRPYGLTIFTESKQKKC